MLIIKSWLEIGIDKELQDEINGIISNENIRVLVERPLIMTIGSFSILRIVNVTNGFNDITLPTGECLSIGFDWDGDMAIISPAPSLKWRFLNPIYDTIEFDMQTMESYIRNDKGTRGRNRPTSRLYSGQRVDKFYRKENNFWR